MAIRDITDVRALLESALDKLTATNSAEAARVEAEARVLAATDALEAAKVAEDSTEVEFAEAVSAAIAVLQDAQEAVEDDEPDSV